MKVFIVHAHPEPASFSGALTDRATTSLRDAGHEVVVSDLYRMGWEARSGRDNFITTGNPNFYKQQLEERYAAENNGFALDIKAEQEKLFNCDLLIFQFPLWWFGVPAILKGWVDKVFAFGHVYDYENMLDSGHLSGRKAMVSVTTGAPASQYTNDANGLGAIGDILYPVNFGTFRFVGFDPLSPFVSWAPSQVSHEERERILDEYEGRLAGAFDETPIIFGERIGQLVVKV
jgi:NAD(P)H dehydrogenase (quinone)